ncbi:MAG TPA: hypothetical protein VKC90_12840 [Chitinophagaceae bacterium]|nr:hypothetical protein [Chitinophagaceae bacterium]
MKKLILLTAVVIFLLSLAYSQNNSYAKDFSNRYRLDLPQEFLRPKIIRTITEILPVTIDELKGRDFCTSGEASYFVKLVIDSFDIEPGEAIFRFKAVLRVYDSSGHSLSHLLIVPYTEGFNNPNKTFDYANNVQYTPNDYVNIYDYSGGSRRTTTIYTGPTIIDSHTVQSQYHDSPVRYKDIFNICKDKIFKIGKTLRKLKVSERI